MGIVVLLILLLVYLWMIQPQFPRRSLPEKLKTNYAHRGLWNDRRPENSLSAFRAAAEAGFGIELDVHLTRDGQLIVHHDNSLKRMCGVDKRIAQTTLAEIRNCRLLQTEEPVPTLDEVLEAVAGRVPLLIEVKVEENNHQALCRTLYARMQRYEGPWCMESFDPRPVRWFRKHAPQIIRGQLAYNHVGRSSKGKAILDVLIASLVQNAASRPDFVAYEARSEGKYNLPMKLIRLMRPYLAAWTVKTPEEWEKVRERYDWIIFEGFIPKA